MDSEQIKKYYLQEKLIEKILEVSKYREVVPRYMDKFGKRPNSINFPGDFKLFVERGATSFHGSVELWRNPLLIDSVKNLKSLRIGWDMIIDIDADKGLEYAKITTELLIEALKEHGINNIDLKFSGSRGFHIAVHRKAFPEKIHSKNISDWYPELHRIIVSYLRDYIEKRGLYERFYDVNPDDSDEFSELNVKNGFKMQPYKIVNPEQNWSQRHLFRLPYSLNEKTWLVSVPIKISDLRKFKMEIAKPENVKVKLDFLKNYEEGEALTLVVQAMDWYTKNKKAEYTIQNSKNAKNRLYDQPTKKIPSKYFPPCIHNILKGLEDGRKRALFILLNFLRSTGYDFEEIEEIVKEWNQKNKEPLKETYVKSQINWHKRKKESVAPPNCFSEGYYTDILVCEPDEFCKNINNPVSYAFRKYRNVEKPGKSVEKKREKKLECPYCGKRYSNVYWYKKHVERCFNK